MDLVLVVFLEKVGYVGTFWARKLLPLQCVIDWVRMGGLGINSRERWSLVFSSELVAENAVKKMNPGWWKNSADVA